AYAATGYGAAARSQEPTTASWRGLTATVTVSTRPVLVASGLMPDPRPAAGLGPALQSLDDLLDHVGGGASVGRDLERRHVVVGGLPRGHQGGDALELVADLEHRAAVPARALVDRLGAGGEHDHGPAGLQQRPVLGPDDGPAAGGDHDLVELDAALHDLGLVVAEDLLAVELEDVGDPHAAHPFDHAVGVDEGELQPARQLPADAALAGAHEARHGDPGDDPLGR